MRSIYRRATMSLRRKTCQSSFGPSREPGRLRSCVGASYRTGRRGPRIPLLINARADTVAEKPAFRDAFRHRRGLMLADGFYEWQQPAKQPFYFRRKGGKPFAFAALWTPAHELGGIGSAALITTDPNEMVAQVHDRMPVLLTADDAPAWLDSTTEDPAKLLPLLRPFDPTDMECWPVSKFVSNARNEAPECIEPI